MTLSYAEMDFRRRVDTPIRLALVAYLGDSSEHTVAGFCAHVLHVVNYDIDAYVAGESLLERLFVAFDTQRVRRPVGRF